MTLYPAEDNQEFNVEIVTPDSKNGENNFRRKKKIHSCINHNDQYIKKYLGESLNNLEVQ